MISKISKNNARRIIYILVLIFSSASIYWADSYTIMIANIDYLDKLFSGDFFSCQFTWGVLCAIILMICDLPVYVAYKCFGVDIYNSYFFKLVAKLDVIIFIYITALFVLKILDVFECNEEEKEAGFLMTMSSSFVFVSCCIVGQVDIVGIMFSIIALYYLIKKDDLKFLFFFSIAFQFKYFPLFYFIPILLYREKRIIKIALYLFIPIIINYVLNIPFDVWNKNTFSNNIGNEILENMTKTKIPLMGNDIPVVFLVYGAICFWAYLKKHDDKLAKYYYVYYGFAGMASILISYKLQGYRIIWLTPFIVLLFFINQSDRRQRLILEVAATGGVTLGISLYNYWFFDFYNMRNNLLDFILPIEKFECVGQEYIYRNVIKPEYYSLWLLLYVIFILYMAYLLITHCPERICNSKDQENNDIIKMMNYRLIACFFIANNTIVIYGICIIRNIINKL